MLEDFDLGGLPPMRILLRSCPLLVALLLAPCAARAVTCTSGSEMTPNDRTAVADVAQQLGEEVARGDARAVQAASAPSLAQRFGDVAATIGSFGGTLKGSAITVDNLYALHATDLGSAADAEFFCSRPNSPILVTVSLGQVPPAEYALVVVHATGVPAPQQFAMVLQRSAAGWQLAGFFVRPLTIDSHGELWFWQAARDLKKRNAPLSAYLYYQLAEYLARPADLFSSTNFEKLEGETTQVAPQGLAQGTPLPLDGLHGEKYSITGMRVDNGLGAMDVRVEADVPALGDPVASRENARAVMSALLARYPELKANFHGLWLFATAKDGQKYALEQPMSSL